MAWICLGSFTDFFGIHMPTWIQATNLTSLTQSLGRMSKIYSPVLVPDHGWLVLLNPQFCPPDSQQTCSTTTLNLNECNLAADHGNFPSPPSFHARPIGPCSVTWTQSLAHSSIFFLHRLPQILLIPHPLWAPRSISAVPESSFRGQAFIFLFHSSPTALNGLTGLWSRNLACYPRTQCTPTSQVLDGSAC